MLCLHFLWFLYSFYSFSMVCICSVQDVFLWFSYGFYSFNLSLDQLILISINKTFIKFNWTSWFWFRRVDTTNKVQGSFRLKLGGLRLQCYKQTMKNRCQTRRNIDQVSWNKPWQLVLLNLNVINLMVVIFIVYTTCGCMHMVTCYNCHLSHCR